MLYTRKGDTGTTKLYGCDGRIAKDDVRIDALGTLDELNSYVGLCRAFAVDRDTTSALLSFQEVLFVIQAQVAGAKKFLPKDSVASLEAIIAAVETEIDPIHSFTISGASLVSAHLDVARTIARRAERSVIAIRDSSLDIVIPYLNRLSSALFALARRAAQRARVKEHAPRY